MSEIKNGGLDQYDAEPFKQQQFGTVGGEEVKSHYRQGVEVKIVGLNAAVSREIKNIILKSL